MQIDYDKSSPSKGDKRGSFSPSRESKRGSSRFNWQVADTIEYGLLKSNAKSNRDNPTEAEAAFWQMVQGNALGETCRRQYVLGGYIVDFFFRKSRLIVEIDGDYHLDPKQQQEDAIRQSWLEHQNYRVIRFSNEQILCDTDYVIRTVKQHLISG